MHSSQWGRAVGLVAAWAGIFGAVAVPSALAQQRIGEAANVRNQVVRISTSGSIGLATGGSVFRDETIRTGRASSAKLVFLDQTNLAIGPTSRVVLDRFVFAGAASAQAVTVNLARGAFRFTTGVLDKRAYTINTPVATIGVRGTVLDIRSLIRLARITLVDNGAALICARLLRRGRPQCVELQNPGDSVEVRPGSVRRIAAPGRKFSFSAICAANPGLCSQTRLAAASPVALPDGNPGDALCGR